LGLEFSKDCNLYGQRFEILGMIFDLRFASHYTVLFFITYAAL